MGIDYLAIVGNSNGLTFHFRLSFIKRGGPFSAESIRIDTKPAASYSDPPSLGLPSLMHGCSSIEYNTYAYTQDDNAPEPFLANVARGATVGQLLEAIFNKHKMDQYT